ncbi:porin family protein [Algoriphagus vanfongensis]|uniref:porin family protein n=1 Tax=Algoriphagus vanfongensis TaxID=426371 RepID=UPI00040D2CEC|nr:porin family protein [Algoriphagus vanfongensis]
MKQFAITIFLFLALAFQASQAQITYGIKGGLNYSSTTFTNDSYKTKGVFGVHIGGFGAYQIQDKLVLHSELLFSTEGNDWEYLVGNQNTGIMKMSLIRLPILLKYQLADNLYVEAGPQLSFLLSISQSIDDGEYVDLKYLYDKVFFGYGLGLSYDLKQVSDLLTVGLRYSGNFSYINNSDVGGEDVSSKLAQLTVGYRLR